MIERGEEPRARFMSDIKGFAESTVHELDAKLKDVRIPRANLGPCPVCGHDIVENRKGFSCWGREDPGCGFVIWKAKAGKTLPMAVAKELIATGRTAKPVTGFKGRSGRSFRARLALQQSEEGKWRVEFDEPWAREGAKVDPAAEGPRREAAEQAPRRRARGRSCRLADSAWAERRMALTPAPPAAAHRAGSMGLGVVLVRCSGRGRATCWREAASDRARRRPRDGRRAPDDARSSTPAGAGEPSARCPSRRAPRALDLTRPSLLSYAAPEARARARGSRSTSPTAACCGARARRRCADREPDEAHDRPAGRRALRHAQQHGAPDVGARPASAARTWAGCARVVACKAQALLRGPDDQLRQRRSGRAGDRRGGLRARVGGAHEPPRASCWG